MTNSTPTTGDGLAAAFALCGIATLTLLANHPKGGGHDFADILREEVGQQLMNGLVHGGFVLVLAALIACFALLAHRLGSGRVPMVLSLVAFCVGSAALMGSMLVDGLVIPQIAARYLDIEAPEKVAAAKALFVFAGALIGVLMPLGLAFQSIAMVSLGWLFVTDTPRRRGAGFTGIALGALGLILLIAAPASMATHVLLACIALQALWYFILAALLFRARRAS